MKPLMNMIYTILRDGRVVGGLIVLLSLTALGGALISEYIFGLEPCVLCLYQRIPYVITALAGLTACLFAAGQHPKIAAFCIFLCALTFLAGSALAFYHSGIEQHWWTSVFEGCKLDFDNGGGNAQSLLERLQATPAVPCDEIPWQDPVIGLSMAAWNSMISFGLFIMALISSVLITRRANGL